MRLRTTRIAPVLAAGVLLCGCENANPDTDTGTSAPSVSDSSTVSVLQDVRGSWTTTTASPYTIRFDADVAFLGGPDGQRMMVRLTPVESCGGKSAPRLVEAIVEHSPDDPAVIGETICWHIGDVEDDVFVIEDVVAGTPYRLSRTSR